MRLKIATGLALLIGLIVVLAAVLFALAQSA
jgi:hypothetical protein